jgi:hypothetical protein
MSYRIRGEHADGGASMAISVESARTALIIVPQWEREGVQRITITNPNGAAYALDQFGGIASVKEEKPDAERT